MLRAIVKNATAYAMSRTRLDELARASLYRHVPFVVCYHRVVERLGAGHGLALPAMEISVAMLEQHLDWLGRHFRIVSLDELAEKLEEPPGAQPLAAVTFDDGYSDIYHHAFPLLKRKGIPAGIFVITDLVGSEELPLHERLHALLVRAWARWTVPRNDLGELLRRADAGSSVQRSLPKAIRDPFSATRLLLESLPQAEVRRVIDCLEGDEDISGTWSVALRPLTWEMLVRMRDQGMTIGSHTKTHAFLTNESESCVREETEESRRELERRLGVQIKCFAYPGGGFDRAVVRAVEAAGYGFAFTICRHQDPRYPLLTIPRTGLWEQSSLGPLGRFSTAIMSCQSAGRFNWSSRCKQAHA